ncbi:hypothetical protein HDU98_008983 [Podochytrium sp. JEL0797]|nr:hypothetical protein HDU98_008983 [Podochytrium sp. JEL0797]
MYALMAEKGISVPKSNVTGLWKGPPPSSSRGANARMSVTSAVGGGGVQMNYTSGIYHTGSMIMGSTRDFRRLNASYVGVSLNRRPQTGDSLLRPHTGNSVSESIREEYYDGRPNSAFHRFVNSSAVFEESMDRPLAAGRRKHQSHEYPLNIRAIKSHEIEPQWKIMNHFDRVSNTAASTSTTTDQLLLEIVPFTAIPLLCIIATLILHRMNKLLLMQPLTLLTYWSIVAAYLLSPIEQLSQVNPDAIPQSKMTAYLVTTILLCSQSALIPARSFIPWCMSVVFLAVTHIPLVDTWGGSYSSVMPWGMALQVIILLVCVAPLVRGMDAVCRETFETLQTVKCCMDLVRIQPVLEQEQARRKHEQEVGGVPMQEGIVHGFAPAWSGGQYVDPQNGNGQYGVYSDPYAEMQQEYGNYGQYPEMQYGDESVDQMVLDVMGGPMYPVEYVKREGVKSSGGANKMQSLLEQCDAWILEMNAEVEVIGGAENVIQRNSVAASASVQSSEQTAGVRSDQATISGSADDLKAGYTCKDIPQPKENTASFDDLVDQYMISTIMSSLDPILPRRKLLGKLNDDEALIDSAASDSHYHHNMHLALDAAADSETAVQLIVEDLMKHLPLVHSSHEMDILCEHIVTHQCIDCDSDDALTELLFMQKGVVQDLTANLDLGFVVLSLIYRLGVVYGANVFRKIGQDMDVMLLPVVAGCSDHRIHFPAVRLLYEVCLLQELSISDLNEFTTDLVVALLGAVAKSSQSDQSEEYNYALIKLLLALNDQFMMKNHARNVIENRVISCLAPRLHLGKSLGANIVFMFNRADNAKVQRLTIRFLYKLFKTPETSALFYTNDLMVIIDVVLRELRAVADENEEIQQGYLKLLPLLLRKLPNYKLDDVACLLRELRRSGTGNNSPSHSPDIADAPGTPLHSIIGNSSHIHIGEEVRSGSLEGPFSRKEYFIAGQALKDSGILLGLGKPGELTFDLCCHDMVIGAMASEPLFPPKYKTSSELGGKYFIVTETDPIGNYLACLYQFLGPNLAPSKTEFEGTLPDSDKRKAEFVSTIVPYIDDALAQTVRYGESSSKGDNRCSVDLGNYDQLRGVAILFLYFPAFNVATVAQPENLELLQKITLIILSAIRKHHGCIRQFNCDDKSLTALLVWGLEGFAHEMSECSYSMAAAMEMALRLKTVIGNDFAIGATKGTVFAGIIGNKNRCDGTLLGVCVNNAARLMCLDRCKGGILCDEETFMDTAGDITYDTEIPEVALKGAFGHMAYMR